MKHIKREVGTLNDTQARQPTITPPINQVQEEVKVADNSFEQRNFRKLSIELTQTLSERNLKNYKIERVLEARDAIESFCKDKLAELDKVILICDHNLQDYSDYYNFLKSKYEMKSMQSELKLNSLLENHPKYQFPKQTTSKTKSTKQQATFDFKVKSHVSKLMEQAKKEYQEGVSSELTILYLETEEVKNLLQQNTSMYERYKKEIYLPRFQTLKAFRDQQLQ